MIGRIWAGIGLWGCICVQALAAPTPAALRRWDAQLQHAALAPVAQRNASDAEIPPMDATRLRRIAEEDPALVAKIAALELLDRAVRDDAVAAAPIDLSAAHRILLEAPGAPGTTCVEPLRIEKGQVLRIDASRAGADGYWLDVHAAEVRPLLLSSRGSQADLRLAAYSDCREIAKPAALVADDNYGLQADLGLAPAHAGQFWRVHVSAIGDGEGVLSLSGGELIRGRVARESNAQGIAGVAVAVFNSAGSYLGSAGTAADGSYQLAVFQGPGSYFARTGQPYYYDPVAWLHEAYGGAYCSVAEAYSLSNCTVGTLTSISVPPDGIAEAIDFALGPGAGVQGRVFDAVSGLPVREAVIDLYSGSGQSLRSVRTDEAGRYRVVGLLPGSVRVVATIATHRGEVHDDVPCELGLSCPVLAGQAVPIVLGSNASVDFALEPWASVAATVDFGSSSGIGTVLVVDANGGPIASSYVGGTGLQRAVVGPLRPGSYRAYFRGEFDRFSQVHGGIDCIGDCAAQLPQGTPIVVAGYGQRIEIGFVPRKWPRVAGTITDSATGAPVGSVQVQLATGSYSYTYTTTGSDGRYALSVPPGTYLVHAGAPEHRNEAYPGVACESPIPLENCAGATALVSDLQASDRSWDFALERNARISGRLTRMGQPMAFDAYVRPLNPARQPLDGVTYVVSANDRYQVLDVPAGTYTFGASNYSSFAQLHPGIDCPLAQFGSVWFACNHAAAQARSVALGEIVSGIDFDLQPIGSRRGRVVRADTLAPIAGVAIDVWNAQGDRVAVAVSGLNGQFSAATIGAGAFALSTDAPGPYIDQVYNGIACPNGPAYEGLCALAGASYVQLPDYDPTAPLLEFRLAPIDPIFANAFD